ncbi:hypothetical protein BC833DRAFT_623306 [Globomyces pollinis-pini]|nr:hypothetical protein BC833DRAFT_623306 [Globomyces pollinis-pini]
MKDIIQCSSDMKEALEKCSAIASSMSARTTIVKQILKKMQEEMNEKTNSNLHIKNIDNRFPPLKNDENPPKDADQLKKEDEVEINSKLNDKHIILTPLDGDWQLDGEILDMTIANNIRTTMNVQSNDLTHNRIDDSKIPTYVLESEWKTTYNPFHPQNWFKTKPQVGCFIHHQLGYNVGMHFTICLSSFCFL